MHSLCHFAIRLGRLPLFLGNTSEKIIAENSFIRFGIFRRRENENKKVTFQRTHPHKATTWKIKNHRKSTEMCLCVCEGKTFLGISLVLNLNFQPFCYLHSNIFRRPAGMLKQQIQFFLFSWRWWRWCDFLFAVVRRTLIQIATTHFPYRMDWNVNGWRMQEWNERHFAVCHAWHIPSKELNCEL